MCVSGVCACVFVFVTGCVCVWDLMEGRLTTGLQGDSSALVVTETRALQNLDLLCTVLYCSAMFHTVLYRSVLLCSVLFCSVLLCSVLFCCVQSSFVLLCSVLLCAVVFCFITALFGSVESELLTGSQLNYRVIAG